MVFPSPGALFSKKARRQIVNCIAASENRYEVGGLLLGYRLRGLHFVTGITVPCGEDAASMVSFTLNGALHAEQAAQLPAPPFFKPSVLGLWHSHICDGARFSLEDQRANEAMARALGSALAVVVSMPADAREASTVYVTPELLPVPCRIFRL